MQTLSKDVSETSVGMVASGIAKIRRLIEENVLAHKQELYGHYLRMAIHAEYPSKTEAVEELICLINRVHESVIMRNRYTRYLSDAMEAKARGLV